MALISTEIINELKTIDLKEFLEKHEGFTFIKDGKDYHRCIEHDSLILKLRDGIFSYCWSSRDQKGDIIEFVKKNHTNGDFRGAIEYLVKGSCGKNSIPKEYKLAAIKEGQTNIDIVYADNMKMVYAYLAKSRKIRPKIINELIQKKLIRQDDKNNLVIRYLDQKNAVVGAELIGTNTFKRFKKTVENTNESYGFTLKFGTQINTIIVFESLIDLLSFYDINFGQLDNAVLLSLGGSEKTKKIQTYLNDYKDIKTIIVCTDNDTAGNVAYNNIKNTYADYNIIDGREQLILGNFKDFNDLLLQRKLTTQGKGAI